ncbi:MAG: DNA polymerase IV [Eubacteriaceae bacterium]|nr:DNA polymerase IV [Eubacteriaceae bacterium]
MDRTILHCDMNGFFASVELLDRPELRNVPVAVCGDPKNRHGIIVAKNEPAKKMGVVTAETIWQAKKKCPMLHCVRPHMDKYKEYCRIINDIYERYTDMVEPFSIDESWLDVSASLKLFGTGIEIADSIRNTVRKETGLTLSAGVSFNKFFAKMGSEYKKPDATTLISRENFRELLWPMDVKEMFFVGKVTAEKLKRYGIKTIGDLAVSEPAYLKSALGNQGPELHDYANGIDDRPVARTCERQKIKSVGHGMTFHRNLISDDDIRTAVVGLSDKISARLRKYQMKASGVKVEIKDPDFSVISRQKQMDCPSSIPEEITKAAMELIHSSWNIGKPIRLLTVTGINLRDEDEDEQLNIFAQAAHGRAKGEKVSRAMDDIRTKYGDSAITFGRIIGNDIGIGPHDPKEDD